MTPKNQNHKGEEFKFKKEIRKIPINNREKQVIGLVEEKFDEFIDYIDKIRKDRLLTIKEFIRLLKEFLIRNEKQDGCISVISVTKKLNNLAGEDLK